jgi:class 3 adenylate cyclase
MDLQAEFPQTPKIMIADDDWLNRELLQTYLANAGGEVFAFSNGAEAWAAVEEGFMPDIALLDIQMPQMNGLELCERLKKRFFIPVIIVTALDAEDEKLRAIEMGADDFVSKPYNSVILLTRVRSLLRLKQLHDELDSRNKLLRQVLTRYVDEEVANVILKDPERYLQLGGVTRNVTVLFADIRGFTKFTEENGATAVVESLNRVFNQLTEVIYQNGGTFDKYLGDAIMAFYGAPVSQGEDVQNAIRTAIGMQKCFTELQNSPEAGLLANLTGLGIGVHTGEAIVGNIGSERVMDYTVIGDTVNVARRLQEVAEPSQILISDATLAHAPSARVKPLKPTFLPGRSEPIMLYSLLGLNETPPTES